MVRFAVEGKMTKSTVYISIGSNIGNREDYLSRAKLALENTVGSILKTSSIYETEAWGKTDQNNFLNQVLMLQTALEPGNLLEKLQNIENELGRERLDKWGPRTLDLDILFYDRIFLNSKNLTIPHPQIVNRRFVLEPLNEIAQEFIHPVENQSIAFLLKECGDSSIVRSFIST